MSFLSFLFKKKQPSLQKDDGSPKTSGKLISEATVGENLVNGLQTWELAEEKKDDLEAMKRCCDAELKVMDTAGLVPAPYYFERVAILSRKVRTTSKKYLTANNILIRSNPSILKMALKVWLMLEKAQALRP